MEELGDVRLDEVMNTDTHAHTPPILVIGGKGKTGRRVAERLAAAGHHVRPLSRSTTPSFAWYDATTWPAALAGTSRAYVTFQPDIGVPAAPTIIHVDDIAEVAVKALTETGHGGRVYELTGPQLLSFHEIAAELGAATGREV